MVSSFLSLKRPKYRVAARFFSLVLLALSVWAMASIAGNYRGESLFDNPMLLLALMASAWTFVAVGEVSNPDTEANEPTAES